MLYDVMTQENQNLQADSEVPNSEFHKQQDTPNGNYVQIQRNIEKVLHLLNKQ